MTSESTRFIVFSLLTSFLVCAASTSFSGQFILDIFGNPIKDLKKAFIKSEEIPKTSSLREDLSRNKDKPLDPQEKMIEVPRNIERPKCEVGRYVDANGVCRQPW